jgi:hypothetical protein
MKGSDAWDSNTIEVFTSPVQSAAGGQARSGLLPLSSQLGTSRGG